MLSFGSSDWLCALLNLSGLSGVDVRLTGGVNSRFPGNFFTGPRFQAHQMQFPYHVTAIKTMDVEVGVARSTKNTEPKLRCCRISRLLHLATSISHSNLFLLVQHSLDGQQHN